MQKKNKKLAVYTLTAVHLLKMCHSQGWVSAGRNLFLPDMRFKPVSTGFNRKKTWKLVSYRYE